MTFGKALEESGVTASTLTVEEKRRLDEQGYVVHPAVYDDAMLLQLQTAFEQVAAGERQDVTGKESGTRHPHDLLNKNPLFIDACLHSKILAAVHHILARSFRLTQCGGRDPLPGYGQQGLHADWMPRANGEPFYAATAICMLDDFTKDNGATQLAPGTHRGYRAVPKAMADPASHHPEEIIVTGKAGSVLLFNGHLWHSGTRNNSQRSRRALQCIFHASESIPPFAQPLYDRVESLTPAVRCFLAG